MRFKIILLLFFIYSLSLNAQLPEEFVYIKDEIPTIKIELRYFSENNFVGTVIDGYKSGSPILTKEATAILKKVQNILRKQQLSLKIYDGYRPQRAVNHFWKWAKNTNDTIIKSYYYPNVAKKDLFKEEYIATRSRHSSGSTIDVTLVDLNTNQELDMGTPYDFFGPESWVNFDGITELQKENRMLLKTVMNNFGFVSYPKEWWHFTLYNEPYKNQYFDFVVD